MGPHPHRGGGVLALNDDWAVVTDLTLNYEGIGTPRLVSRNTGESYDVGALVAVPPIYDSQYTTDVELLDDYLVWSLDTDSGGFGDEELYDGVYAVALGATGPEGGVLTLDSAVTPAEPRTTYSNTFLVSSSGARVAWVHDECATGVGCTESLSWFDAPPSTGEPQSVEVTGNPIAVDGTVAVLNTDAGLTWIDLANGGTTLATAPGVTNWPGVPRGFLTTNLTPRPGCTLELVDGSGAPLTGTPGPLPAYSPFTDVRPGDPFAGEITWLSDAAVVRGYPDGTFRGLASVNRDALAAFLYRAVHGAADPPSCTTAPFTDVPVTHPFCGQIAWLAASGIATGWPDGTFRPATPISREAVAAFLYRLAHDGGAAPRCENAPFLDVTTGHPFCGEIAWVAQVGIARGWGGTVFRPGANLERQAMAAFLFRTIDGGWVPVG